MQNTTTHLNPVHEELLNVYLLAVNRLSEVRCAVRGMTKESDSLPALRLLNNLQMECWALERLLFRDAERAS